MRKYCQPDDNFDPILDTAVHSDDITFAVHGELPPSFGLDANPQHGVIQYVAWWSDGEDSRYESN
jgi:hypothetical protein